VPFKNITTEALQIYEQNIQGLRWKSSDVLNFLYSNLPHILCFTEHHLNQREIELIRIDSLYSRCLILQKLFQNW